MSQSKLPQGWVRSHLGDVLPLSYGKGLTERARVSNGSVPVVGSSGVVGSHNLALTSGPTLVIGRKGNVGACYLIDQACWPIDTVYYTVASPGKNLRIFQYLLESLDLRRLDKSTAIPGLSRDDFNAVEFGLPPAAEQERIVELLDSYLSQLDAAVESLIQVKTKLKAYRASILKAAVEGRLVPTEAELAKAEGRSYEPADKLLERIQVERSASDQRPGSRTKARDQPTRVETSDLPSLPGGWVWASPSQLSSGDSFALAIGPFGSNLVVADYRSTGVPLVFVRNVRTATFSNPDRFVSPGKAASLAAHKVSPGDVLITKMGEPPGDATVYPDTAPEGIVTADVVKWTLAPNLSAKYFAFATKSDLVHRQIVAITQGVAQRKISLERFRNILYPVPPAAEQLRIAVELERLISLQEAGMRQIELNFARVARLRQSILKAAFEGQLVDQDPNDEPASELLARLRATPEPAPKPKRGRAPKKTS